MGTRRGRFVYHSFQQIWGNSSDIGLVKQRNKWTGGDWDKGIGKNKSELGNGGGKQEIPELAWQLCPFCVCVNTPPLPASQNPGRKKDGGDDEGVELSPLFLGLVLAGEVIKVPGTSSRHPEMSFLSFSIFLGGSLLCLLGNGAKGSLLRFLFHCYPIVFYISCSLHVDN